MNIRSSVSRILLPLLCLAALLCLAGCGSTGTANTPSAQTAAPTSTAAASFAWKSEFVNVSDQLGSDEAYLSPSLFTDEGFYATANEKVGRREVPEGTVEEYEGEFDLYATTLYFIDFSGKMEKLPNYTPIMAKENTEGYKDFTSYTNLGRLTMNPDGNLVTLLTSSANWYDGPEDIYNTPEAYEGDYYHYEQEYSLLVLAPDGSEISRAPVEIEGQDVWLNSWNSICDADGNLIVVRDISLLAIAPDGSIAWQIDNENYINSMVRLPDGRLAVSTFDDQGPMLCIADLEAKEFSEEYPLPNGAWNVFPGDEEYDCYYNSGLYLYGMKLGEEEPVRLLNWMNCDINADSIDTNSLNFASDGTIRGVFSEYGGEDVETQLFVLTKVPADTLPKKQILTIAQLEYNPDYQLTNRIARYNRSQDAVHVEYKDYSEYNTEEDMSAGFTKFMTEVMAGNLPDILPTNRLPYRQLAAKGLLEDLYPYLDADPALSREDLFPNVLQALEVNGKLFQIVPSFSVETLMGAASIVGDEPGWTYDDFYEALAKMPEDCSPMEPYITRDMVLNALLSANIDRFVDWSTGTVNFETDEFKQLLEFTKSFPADYNWDEHEVNESTQELLKQGRQMLTRTSLYSIDSVLWNDTNLGGKATCIGWPVSEGVGNILQMDNGFAISKNCADKDAAWAFIRSMLTDDAQKSVYSIPVNRRVFQSKVEEMMTPMYRKDASGNVLLDENGEKIQIPRGGYVDENGQEQFVYAMTQEQADTLISTVESCTRIANYDTSITSIVQEQVPAFYTDQKSLDEVCRLIQSKANLYVNEQR